MINFSQSAMPRTRKQIFVERRRLRAEYGQLFDSIASLLFQYDRIGIAFENPNIDEYEPETGTILPRLRQCESTADVRRVVHEEFVRWFDGAETAGPEDRYSEIASAIWQLWQKCRDQLPDAGSQV
jgi:hypothetical protein